MKTRAVVIIALGLLCMGMSALSTQKKPVVAGSNETITFSVDANAAAQRFPGAFMANLNLDGGSCRDETWPCNVADIMAIEKIEKEIGFSGVFRLKWDFWQIGQLDKDKDKQKALIAHYEEVVKKISDAKGTVIVNLVYTPPGMGKTLDKRSVPEDIAKWKELARETIKNLSCEKKYSVWYEVWDNPAQEAFFLGEQADYLNMYRAVSRAILELEKQYDMHIPVGGPAVQQWWDNFDGNSPTTPERSLIYDLMRFCSQNNLPLDFISWDSFSTEENPEGQQVAYGKSLPGLIREWLGYFGFPKETTLVLDEWSWGVGGVNVMDERGVAGCMPASYLFSRVKNMYAAGVDTALVYTLEDAHDADAKVASNFGVFAAPAVSAQPNDKPSAKPVYKALRMFSLLGDQFLPVNPGSDFVSCIATKKNDSVALVIWHYVDPYLVRNQVERIMPQLSEKEQAVLMDIIKTNRIKDILNKTGLPVEVTESEKLSKFFEWLIDEYHRGRESLRHTHEVAFTISNLKGMYHYAQFVIDAYTDPNAELKAREEKKSVVNAYSGTIKLEPYTAVVIVLEKMED